MDKNKKDVKRFTSLENALNLLELFSPDEPEFGINEIAERLGVANSTAHRLVMTLLSEGFITKDLHTKLYRLGTSTLTLGNIVMKQSRLHRISQSVLDALVQQVNETAYIGILSGNKVVYSNKAECSHPFRLLTYLGKTNPIHCTATGLVLLAHQSPKFINEFLDKKLGQYTPKTIVNSSTLLNQLKQIKEQGYSFCIEEFRMGVSSISVPIRDPYGQVIASISVAGPIQRINSYTAPKIIKLLTNTANEISDLLHKPL